MRASCAFWTCDLGSRSSLFAAAVVLFSLSLRVLDCIVLVRLTWAPKSLNEVVVSMVPLW